MKTYWPFILTAILSIAISYLISSGMRGRSIMTGKENGLEVSLMESARKGRASTVFVYNLTSDTASWYGSDQTGSGVIISEDGYIVTNYHVIVKGALTRVRLEDKREFTTQLVGIDSSHDIALLKINASALPFLEFGDVESLRIGEQVLAVGNPYRLLSTVTSGIVSAKDRELKVKNNATKTFIQTDAPINMGNSGGALLNAKAELMGLTVVMITTSGEYEGFAFAIPSNLVKKIVEDIQKFGSNQIGSVAMVIRPVTAEIAREAGMTEIHGVVVESLRPGGAADVAGLKSLDIILSVNGRKVYSNSDFMGQQDLYRPGDVITLHIIRDGELLTVDVLLQEVLKN